MTQRRGLLLVDQAVSTVSNLGFLLAITFVVQWPDERRLALLVLALSIGDMIVACSRVALGEVGFLAEGPIFANSLPIFSALVSMIVVLPVAVVMLVFASPFVALAVVLLPMLVSIDLSRYRFFRDGRTSRALKMDSTWGAASILALALIVGAGAQSEEMMLAAFVVTGTASAFVFGGFEYASRWSEFSSVVRTKWRAIGSGATEFVMTSGSVFLLMLTPPIALGVESATPIRLSVAVFGPIGSVLLTPLVLILSRRWADRPRASEYWLGLGLVGGLIGGLLALAILGGEFVGYGPVVGPSFLVFAALLMLSGVCSRIGFTFCRALDVDSYFNLARACVWVVRLVALGVGFLVLDPTIVHFIVWLVADVVMLTLCASYAVRVGRTPTDDSRAGV